MNKNTAGYIAIISLLALTSFFSLNLFLRQRSDYDVLDIRNFPYTLGEWSGRDLEIKEYEYDILETRNILLREYANPAGKKIYLFVVYSETNRSVFHPPEVCLIGSGITITHKTNERLTSEKLDFLANKLYLEKGDKKEIALYSYKSGNLYTDNYYIQQMHFAFNQLLGRHTGGATIRISMPIDKSETTTLVTLKSLMTDVVHAIEELS